MSTGTSVSIRGLLKGLVQNGGSDLHVSTNSTPMLRIRGEMFPTKVPPLTNEQVKEMVTTMAGPKQIEEIKNNKQTDFAFTAQGIGIFRVNVFFQRHGLSIVCRVLPEEPPSLAKLGLPPIFKTASAYPNGLILITGPTGSGKSTTLAAMINYINHNKAGHILTIEDPVEFRHETKKCMVNQRSLGDHFITFSGALKAALREDPDVILVGEMRDLETIKLAMEAAETGHLVFGTLHTNSAAKTVDRIINVFPAEEQNQVRISLSESLRMIVSQKLVPSADKTKRICFQDIMINNHATGNLIRENKTNQIISTMQTGKSQGMQLLDKELLLAVRNGDVDGKVAWEFANDKNMFKEFAPKENAIGADNNNMNQRTAA